jgi:hypothetical protein
MTAVLRDGCEAVTSTETSVKDGRGVKRVKDQPIDGGRGSLTDCRVLQKIPWRLPRTTETNLKGACCHTV